MKKIIFLCGVLLSVPLMGMELVRKEDVDKERTLWPRHVTPLIIEARRSEDSFLFPSCIQAIQFIGFCSALACVNRELSEDVPYETVRLTSKLHGFKSPLSLIIKKRQALGVLYRDPLTRERYLRVAKRFLEDNADSNLSIEERDISNKITPLQHAAYYRDKELCKLFLEHGGNPYITTIRWEPQGPGYEWTAFDYANKYHQWYGPGDGQPHGWLKDMWDEVSSFAKATADKQ